MGTGVLVESYFTDNCIYTSKGFTRELYFKGQGINSIGVGFHHHDVMAENAIMNMVRLSRTMMIYTTLRWPDASVKSL